MLLYDISRCPVGAAIVTHKIWIKNNTPIELEEKSIIYFDVIQ